MKEEIIAAGEKLLLLMYGEKGDVTLDKGPFNIYRETGPVFGRLRGKKKVKPC